MKSKICIGCNKVFYKTKNLRGIKWTGKKYCTHKCYLQHHVNWNTGKTYKDDNRIARPWLNKVRHNMIGKKNWAWKGNRVGYRALHRWVESRLGKANHCEVNNLHKSTRYHWANISHKYKRDLNDWMQMCPSCNGQDRRKY